MGYAEFQATDDYSTKKSGAQIEVLIINEDDPSDELIGATTGISWNEDYENIPIEELGNDGVDEIAQGRHTIGFTVPAFFTPEWNDSLPTRSTYKGKSYTVVERIGKGWPGEGTVLNAIVGNRLNRIGSNSAARGAKTFDLAFTGTDRYNGAEWAALSGTQ